MAALRHIAEATTPILFVLFCLFSVQSTMPTPAPSENSTQLRLNEVLIGAKTLDRFVVSFIQTEYLAKKFIPQEQIANLCTLNITTFFVSRQHR